MTALERTAESAVYVKIAEALSAVWLLAPLRSPFINPPCQAIFSTYYPLYTSTCLRYNTHAVA